MEQINLAKNAKLVVKDNVLAVLCDNALKVVSSAFYNGGSKQVKAVLNVGVPEGYNDLYLHLDPLQLINSSAAKLGFTENSKDFVAMVTAAKIQNYTLITKQVDDFSVSVAATAGCQHGESSGEEMDVQEIHGTINIIVLIDANPTDSCMVASIITATEAKSAALRDLDIRSLYTGDSATGSITDSVTIASTHQDKTIGYGGPASKLGKTVGYCTRKAVTESLLKQEPFWGSRTVFDRLKERHLPLEKLAAELCKVKGITVDEKGLAEILKNNPLANAYLLAASKLDDDFKKNMLPAELGEPSELSKCFGSHSFSKLDCSKIPSYDSVDLPPFIKTVLIKIILNASLDAKPKRLK